jgi:hypothetical protein
MGGIVRENDEKKVKIHLFGRLGVITVLKKMIRGDREPVAGTELRFYFSYVKVNNDPYDYDTAAVDSSLPMTPVLAGGTIAEVNDTAIQIKMVDDLVTVAVPRRWVFTDVTLEKGQKVEFYISSMEITGQRELIGNE